VTAMCDRAFDGEFTTIVTADDAVRLSVIDVR
jgi:hypothetical protein